MKTISLAFLSVSVFISACADPAADKPKAQTTSPSVTTDDESAAKRGSERRDVLARFKATGTELAIVPETSKVEFTGSKVTGKHDGGFKIFKGVIDLVGDKAESSNVLFEIDMASVFTDTDDVTKHLQTADFFYVEKYPKSTFVSTNIVPDTSGGGKFTVTGELVMRGVSKTVTFPADITVTPDSASIKAEFSINRKDFGIVYAGKADDLIREDVVLRLDLKAAKK